MAKFKMKDTSKMTDKQLRAYLKSQNEFELYGKSRAMYKGVVRSAIRQLWMKSKGRGDALKRSRRPNTGEGRHKFFETCEVCGKKARIGEKELKVKANGELSKAKQSILVVHHTVPCPDVFDPQFLIRMFCDDINNPADGYEVLCHTCHKKAHDELDLALTLMEKPNG